MTNRDLVAKLPLFLFLSLFLIQTILLSLQLTPLAITGNSIRPYLAALIPSCCYWSLLVLVRQNKKIRPVDTINLLPPLLNSFELISFDYSLVIVQLIYAVLIIWLVFDFRVSKFKGLKIAVLLFGILFFTMGLFDLLISLDIRSGTPLADSLALFISLFIIHSLLIVVISLAVSNPNLIHQLLSDVQFATNKVMSGNDDYPSEQAKTKFKLLKEELKRKELYLEEGFDLNFLANSVNLPARELSGIINQVTNKNFSAFINDLKIDKAKALLRDESSGKKSVTQVMFESGFVTKSSFNKQFSLRTGMSPTQYRQSLE